MTRLLVAAALVLMLGGFGVAEDDTLPRNRVTGPPHGHPPVWGKASDELRRQASQLRLRAMDSRDAADELRARGRGDRADELEDRADELEDRSRSLDQRADMMDAQGENADRGMVLPSPNPALP